MFICSDTWNLIDNTRDEKKGKIIMEKFKIVKANEKIAEKVVDIFEKIEDTVVGSYTKIEDDFIDLYLIKDGETIEEAKKRLKKEREKREEETIKNISPTNRKKSNHKS